MRIVAKPIAICALILFAASCTPPPDGGQGPGSISFTSGTATVTEGQPVTLSVTRTGGTEGPVSVETSTSDGSATAGSDYTAAGETLSWSDGEGGVKTFTIDTVEDADAETNEAFQVVLENPTGAGLGSFTSVTVTIQDDDAPMGAPTIVSTHPNDGATDVALNQNISVTFSEPMDQAATESAISVDPAVSCVFGWNVAGDRITCNPQSDLAVNTSYEVTVGPGAQAASGESVASTGMFSFTTGTTTLATCTFGASTFGDCVFAP